MKKYSSRTLQVIAWLYLCFPILYLVYAAVIFDIPMGEIGDVIFSPSFVIACGISVIAGFGLWQMKRWSWYVFMLATLFMMYISAYICFAIGQSHNKILAYLTSIVLPIVLIFRVTRELRVPYFLPKIRWWESSTEYQVSVPVQIVRRGGEVTYGKIMDMSVAGCFIKTKDDIDQDEKISLVFDVFGQMIRCQGSTVWLAGTTVTHPKGIGVKFGRMRRHMRRRIRIAAKRMQGIAKLYRSSRSEIDKEAFLANLEKIQFRFDREASEEAKPVS